MLMPKPTFHYLPKHCLFCRDKEELVDLYPKTFSDADLTPDVFSARRITEHFHYAIVKCKNCGLVFSKEVLDDEALTYLYSQSKVTFSEHTELISKDYLSYLQSCLSKNKKGKALEIGCSTGFFLETLLRAGFQEVHGCEPSAEAIEKAASEVKRNIHPGLFKEGLYPESHFDLVCSFQTLDHISDPVAVVKNCYKILRDESIACFITHNVKGLHARLFGERSPVFDVEHIYLFDPDTLSRLLRESGFEDVKVFPVKNTYPLSYWVKMAPVPFKKIVLSILSLLGLSNIRVRINAGNIGVVGRRK